MRIEEADGLGDAGYYEHWYGRRPPVFYAGVLSEVIRYGRPGNLLELGCGAGLILQLAVEWGMDVVGCDGSAAAVELASGRLPVGRVYNCKLSENLPFPDRSFDNVLLNQVIEHLPEQILLKCLDECARVLRSGGTAFIFSPSRANREEVRKDPTHINPLLPSELRNMLRQAEFDVMAEPNSWKFRGLARLAALETRLLQTTYLCDRFTLTANAYARKR